MNNKTLEIANSTLHMRVEFRPIIQFSGNTIFRYEALARFFNTEGFQTHTQQTLDELNRCGLISEVSDFLFETLCELLNKKASLTLSLNLSRLLINDIDHLAALYKTCQRHHVQPERIELSANFSKSQIINNLPFLHQAKAYGFMTALTDSGNGTLPEESVQLFGFDTLKLAHASLESIAMDTVKFYRLQRFVAKFIASGASVICEGAKKSSDLALLKKYNHIGMRGYHFHRTLTFSQLQLLEDV